MTKSLLNLELGHHGPFIPRGIKTKRERERGYEGYAYEGMRVRLTDCLCALLFYWLRRGQWDIPKSNDDFTRGYFHHPYSMEPGDTWGLAHKNRPLMPGHQLLAFKPSETSRAYLPLAKRKFWRFWQLHSKSLLIYAHCALCESDKVVVFNTAALLKISRPCAKYVV